MIPDRYFAPSARTIFSDQRKIERWVKFTEQFALDALRNTDARGEVAMRILNMKNPTPEAVATREGETGHDVVAFLSLLEDQLPGDVARFLHYGMTSSDLVDNAHFEALRDHSRSIDDHLTRLIDAMSQWGDRHTERAGRTHGQIAAVTSWHWQMHVNRSVFIRLQHEFGTYARHVLIKSVGPTGISAVRHNPAIPHSTGPTASTQVIPRDYQTEWAALYLRLAGALENLALLVRLGARSEVQEVREGAERVGSSAMPHKTNPIDSEKVCGLARVARGYVFALAECGALWEDRDLTNSAAERIACADLAATVEHMVITMTKVMRHLRVDAARMGASARKPVTSSNIMQALAQKHFNIGPVRAGRLIRDHVRFDPELKIASHKIVDEMGVTPDAVDQWIADVDFVTEQQFR